YSELLTNAVTIPSDATDKLCEAAKLANAYVVMGMSERNVEASGASLYNTMLYIDAQGEILGKHRKLVPAGGERLVWAQGDGSTLAAYDTPFGKLGGLIAGKAICRSRATRCTPGVPRPTSPRPGIAASRGSRRSATSPKRAAAT